MTTLAVTHDTPGHSRGLGLAPLHTYDCSKPTKLDFSLTPTSGSHVTSPRVVDAAAVIRKSSSPRDIGDSNHKQLQRQGTGVHVPERWLTTHLAVELESGSKDQQQFTAAAAVSGRLHAGQQSASAVQACANTSLVGQQELSNVAACPLAITNGSGRGSEYGNGNGARSSCCSDDSASESMQHTTVVQWLSGQPESANSIQPPQSASSADSCHQHQPLDPASRVPMAAPLCDTQHKGMAAAAAAAGPAASRLAPRQQPNSRRGSLSMRDDGSLSAWDDMESTEGGRSADEKEEETGEEEERREDADEKEEEVEHSGCRPYSRDGPPGPTPAPDPTSTGCSASPGTARVCLSERSSALASTRAHSPAFWGSAELHDRACRQPTAATLSPAHKGVSLALQCQRNAGLHLHSPAARLPNFPERASVQRGWKPQHRSCVVPICPLGGTISVSRATTSGPPLPSLLAQQQQQGKSASLSGASSADGAEGMRPPSRLSHGSAGSREGDIDDHEEACDYDELVYRGISSGGVMPASMAVGATGKSANQIRMARGLSLAPRPPSRSDATAASARTGPQLLSWPPSRPASRPSSRSASTHQSEGGHGRPAGRLPLAPRDGSSVRPLSASDRPPTRGVACDSGGGGAQRPASPGRSSWGPPPGSPSSTSRRSMVAAPQQLRTLHPAVIANAEFMLLAAQAVNEVPLDEKRRPYPYILPPVFPGAPPTVSFCGTASEKQAAGLHPFTQHRLLVRYAGIANSPVKAAFKEAGMRPTKAKATRWVVCWGGLLDVVQLAALHEFQRVNHFPGTWELGRKDYLYRNVYNMRRLRGGAFDIVPRFFLLPRDYDEFRADYERFPDRMYIQKPSNSSRGRGIRMVSKPSEITRDCKDVLVQQYIHNPLLLDGFKFDMRIYAAATCLDPLRLYVYEDGLARFATEQYSQDRSDLKKRCVHLTNYSVNKTSSKFVDNPAPGSKLISDDITAFEASDDGEGVGSKWSISALRQRIEADGKVHDILAKSLIAAEPRMNTDFKMKVPYRTNCFEVWGFDIMLDDTFRAWLIEANTCPSLAAATPMDKRVKNGMVADVMHMVGPVPYDPEVYEATQELRRQARLTGLGPRAGGEERGKARTLKEAEGCDFRGVPAEELPDIIVEAEAEYARRGGWERVFPCTADPFRYCDLFETPRSNNIITCKYYAQKAAAARPTKGNVSAQGSCLTPPVSSTSHPVASQAGGGGDWQRQQ